MYEFGSHVREVGLAAWLGLGGRGHLLFLTKEVGQCDSRNTEGLWS